MDRESPLLEKIRLHDDGRPRINLQVSAPPGNSNWSTMSGSCGPFWITNYGARAARMIRFDPIPSKSNRFNLKLDEVALLSTQERPPLGFHFGHGINGDWGRLQLFFQDNPNNESTLHYSIRATFLDVNGDQLEERLTLEAEMPECKLRIFPTQL
jgi:hypothetical protein